MEQTTQNFQGLGLAPKLLQTLDRLKFTIPTPIQHKTIPLALEGNDIIGIAQTGTGKTLAFALPTLQRLAQGTTRALVLVPTRELALQVKDSFAKFAPAFGMQVVALIGGDSIKRQIFSLSKHPRIVIATPGRLIDLMKQRKVSFGDLSILVLDEADQMFDMGFAPQINEILRSVPKNRQTMIFSATMPGPIVRMVTEHMKTPVSVEVAPPGTAAERVTHELFIVRNDMKKELLKKILTPIRGSVLVFCRTKIGVAKLARVIKDFGYTSAEIHSDLTLGRRRQALDGFKAGRYKILVATDIAARGIDVKGIECVVNYDLPDNAENYVHRIGRTGRAGYTGRAVSIATPDQKKDVMNIEQLLKIVIPISTHPEIPPVEFEKPAKTFTRSFRSRPSSFRSRRR